MSLNVESLYKASLFVRPNGEVRSCMRARPQRISKYELHQLPGKRRRKGQVITLLSLLALLIVGSVIGAVYLLMQNTATLPTGTVVGQASFLSSADITRYSIRGVYDELLLQLNNVPDPATGENYYAWLLSDNNHSPLTTIFLGKMPVKQGKIDFLYAGDQEHNSLIGNISRLVVAEEKTQSSSSSALPLPDHSTWRYYGALPQTPLAADGNHLSMLDHLRALVTENSLLQNASLPGGLDTWLATNTEKVLEWAGSARDYWGGQGSTTLMHNHFVRILDYLDGIPAVQRELPSGTDLLLDPHPATLGLIGLNPLDSTSHTYLREIQDHLTAINQTPGLIANSHKLINEMNTAIHNVTSWLQKVHDDAKQLVNMNSQQLLEPSTLSILDDMQSEAFYAYTGELDPTTNAVLPGVMQIHYDIEHLATFDVAVYATH